MISLPDHGCCADDPRLAGAEPYGDLDARNVATCSLRRRWGEHDGDAPGCGARLSLCHGCGLRTRVLRPGELVSPPCEACGGTVRPRPEEVLTSDPTHASSVDVDPSRSIVQPKAPEDTAVSRVEKGRAAAKRTTVKRVRKGAPAQEGPTLPGVK